MQINRIQNEKHTTIMETKKKYITPRIEWIPLDNKISLALESNPPEGPNEGLSSIEHSFNNNPYSNLS